MMSTLLIGAALLAAGPDRETLAPPDLAAYDAANSRVGREPAAHIKLALWCEAHGLQAERMKHLAIAVMTDPANATARGLMGLVAYRGRWQRPDAVGEKVKADGALVAVLAEYNARRDKASNTADDQWRLALWCEEQGLEAEGQAHLATVVLLDPKHASAWKRLGFKKHDGRWMTAEQVADEKAEAALQKQADRHWKAELERLRDRLKDRNRRDAASLVASRITDPRAVPMICRILGTGNEADQRLATQLLAQIDAPSASRALAVMAVFSRYAEVRRVAGEVLVRRDPREFAGVLVGFLRKPVKYEVRPVAGPGSRGELFVEGERFNVRRLYSTPAAPSIRPGDQVGFDASGQPIVMRTVGYFWTPEMRFRSGSDLLKIAESQRISQFMYQNGLGPGQYEQAPYGPLFANTSYANSTNPYPVYGQMTAGLPGYIVPGSRISFEMPIEAQIPMGRMTVEAQQAARVAEGQLEGDLAKIKKFNAPILEINGRLFPLLAKVSGEDLGEDPQGWSKWAVDLMGYAFARQKVSEDTPTVVEEVPIAFQAQAAPLFGVGAPVAARLGHSCFGGGTPVTTLAGRRPIESLRVGDQVLTQDGTTGELSYQPVVVVYHNPPNHTLRIGFEGETIEVTGIHRFWKAGAGWTMARELEPGDVVRRLGGVSTVANVDAGRDQPVFNLEVARGRSFFVGEAGLLVHDNSLVEPVSEPFDASTGLETAARSR